MEMRPGDAVEGTDQESLEVADRQVYEASHSSPLSGRVARGSWAWSRAMAVRLLKASLRTLRPTPTRRLNPPTCSGVTPSTTCSARKLACSSSRSKTNIAGCLHSAPRPVAGAPAAHQGVVRLYQPRQPAPPVPLVYDAPQLAQHRLRGSEEPAP